ncbi:MAG TPA: SMI1/KNR4 family protein [Polyangiaceae bacterium]|jgi:hypothetical protein|nr:SMI1/KNR4 family protein [Polyangiaceae bacterium]
MTDRAALDPALQSALALVALRGPVSQEDLQAALSVAAGPLPEDYLAFLRVSDGAEGWVGKNYLQISPARSAAGTTAGFAQWVPGLYFFASDGAEGLFAFDLREGTRRVALTHTDDLNFDGLVYAAESFTVFLGFLKHGDWSKVWYEQRSGRRTPPT